MYGVVYDEGRRVAAHRVSWVLTFGPIPDGLFVLHRCDNPPCVRPDHLFLGTARDNILDAYAKGRAIPPTRDHHGERHPQARLTAADVLRIRELALDPSLRRIDIAVMFGISKTEVVNIISRKRWPSIPEGRVVMTGDVSPAGDEDHVPQ